MKVGNQWYQRRPRMTAVIIDVVYDGPNGERVSKRFDDAMSSACRRFYREQMTAGKNPTLRKVPTEN